MGETPWKFESSRPHDTSRLLALCWKPWRGDAAATWLRYMETLASPAPRAVTSAVQATHAWGKLGRPDPTKVEKAIQDRLAAGARHHLDREGNAA